VEIVYAESNKKIYGADRLISLKPKPEKKGETIRSMDDYDFDFSKLIELQNDERIAKVRYYTEIPAIEDELKTHNKFEKMTL
jgi:CRISPR-associated protein Csh2